MINKRKQNKRKKVNKYNLQKIKLTRTSQIHRSKEKYKEINKESVTKNKTE